MEKSKLEDIDAWKWDLNLNFYFIFLLMRDRY